MPDLIENSRKININEFPKDIPDFTSTFEPKESVVKKWIINWILSSISKKTIKENDIMPKKSELSEYLGVSVGTVQNAIRGIEDTGLLKSKQKLGTMISTSSCPLSHIKKSTSKRDKAISSIKRIIVQNNYKVGFPLPSARKMAEMLNISPNTVRLAYENLSSAGILDPMQYRGNEANWILKSIPHLSKEDVKQLKDLSADTLVKKTADDLKTYLSENFEIGDKIPSHEELSRYFNVSIKTIHDSVTNLCSDGILFSRRGRYGTILAKNPQSNFYEPLKENSIFANSADSNFYAYQKVEEKIINMLKNNYKIGDKIPSMKELSTTFDVSTNTIRKALINLSNQGYLSFGRGRFGGTFLLDIPESVDKQPYQWLSINPKFL